MIFTTLRLFCSNESQMEYCLNNLSSGKKITTSLHNDSFLVNVDFSHVDRPAYCKDLEAEMLDYINENKDVLSFVKENGRGLMLFTDVFHYDEYQSGIFLSSEFISTMAEYHISLAVDTYH